MQTVAMKPLNPVVPDSLTMGKDDLIAEMTGEDGVVPGAELDLAARSAIDSTYIEDIPQDTSQTYADSVYVITKDKELRLLKYNFPDSLKFDEATGRYVSETPEYVVQDVRFNVEQDNYMWYLRNSLVLPDVRLSQLQQNAQKEAEVNGSKNKKKKAGFFGFFKNLFKKKDKGAATDSTNVQTPAQPTEEEFDYVDEDEQLRAQQGQPQQQEPEKKKGLFGKKKDKEEKNIKKSKTLYGIASFYADKFEGRQTATGAIYSHNKLTAACNVLPLRTWIKVTNLRNNKSVIVQVNDRLHPKNKRIVDMSRMAAGQLGYIGRGLTQVKVEVLNIKKAKK